MPSRANRSTIVAIEPRTRCTRTRHAWLPRCSRPRPRRSTPAEKLQAYCGIESLGYYLLVDSERAAVSYRIRGAGDEWLAATLDPGERLEIECGPVRASVGLGEIYDDTRLAA